MAGAFKYIRILTAIVLPIIVIYNFLQSLIQQSQVILDGPLTHFISYTFAINKIVLAGFLSMVLWFDFKIDLPLWGNIVLRIFGLISILLSLIGFVYIFKQQQFSDMPFLAEFYLFQTAYLLISVIIWGKSFKEKTNA